MLRIKPDCFVILTATALPFAEESLFTRLLPLELAAIKNPIPEYAMQRAITDNLEGIWMGILGMMNTVVSELRKVRTAPAPTESRLADFTVFCNRIRGLTNGDEGILDGDTLIKGLETMINRQKGLLNEASPFVALLDVWLQEDRENSLRQGRGPHGGDGAKWHTATELNTILSRMATRSNVNWIWDTGHSLSKHIQALEINLNRHYGMDTRAATNNSPKSYRFLPNAIDLENIEIPDNIPKDVPAVDKNEDIILKRRKR
jgi:hypothetical protein